MLWQSTKLASALSVLVGIGIMAATQTEARAGTPVKTAVLTKSADGGAVRTAEYRADETRATITPVQWGWRGGYVARPYYRSYYYRTPYPYYYSYGYGGDYYTGYAPYYTAYNPYTYASPYYTGYAPAYTYSYPYPYTYYYYGPRYGAYYGGYYGW